LFREAQSLLCNEAAAQVCAIRYYLHIRLQGELLLDQEGLELSDIVEAQAEAENIARELSGDLLLDVERAEVNAVEITGTARNVLFSVLMCGSTQLISI